MNASPRRSEEWRGACRLNWVVYGAVPVCESRGFARRGNRQRLGSLKEKVALTQLIPVVHRTYRFSLRQPFGAHRRRAHRRRRAPHDPAERPVVESSPRASRRLQGHRDRHRRTSLVRLQAPRPRREPALFRSPNQKEHAPATWGDRPYLPAPFLLSRSHRSLPRGRSALAALQPRTTLSGCQSRWARATRAAKRR